MADEIVKIYSLKVGNEQKKAIDLVSLNSFMDKRIRDSNPVFMDGVDGMTIGEYRSVLYSRVLLELNMEVKIQLGMLERPKEPQQQKGKQEQIIEPEEDEPQDEEPSEQEQRRIQVPPRKKEAKQEVEDMLSRNKGDDDIVVLE